MASLLNDILWIFSDSEEGMDNKPDSRFGFPDPYFMWKDEEKIIPANGTLTLASNTFKFVACCLASNPVQVNEDDQTYQVLEKSREHLQKALDFLEEDQRKLDAAPVDWDKVDHLGDIFVGVSVDNKPEVDEVKIGWDSILGKCIRKNKLALGLFDKPDDGFLSASKQETQNLVTRLCEAKLKPVVKAQLLAFQVMCV